MNSKKLSNPFSTGGGGSHFEAHVQASFVTLMLTGGYAPCLPCLPINEIKLQGKKDGFDTDDLIVFIGNGDRENRRKLLGQVKHSIGFTLSSSVLSEVIHAAWKDYNNPKIFSKGKDIIALITGRLSATDSRNVQWLLNQARHTKNVDEFYRNVEQANFSPSKSSEKLAVIQHHLKVANNNIEVSKDTIYDFLNHYHLLVFDLGQEVGVHLSLLQSHISQFNKQAPEWVWSRVVDVVQTWNHDGGTITHENLPEDLIEVFRQPVFDHIPEELTNTESEIVKTDWSQHQFATNLALINLIGAWDEKSKSDLEVFDQLLGEAYSTWIPNAREILQIPDTILLLKNGLWKITERTNLWMSLGSRIFDQNLDSFKSIVVAVMTKRNPSFDLPVEERFSANIHGKVLPHSSTLRKGLADGLAILGSEPDALINCSQGKAEATANLTIREIFDDADWVLWGSLNNLLPTLAEAAPREFLNAVEKALRLSPCPFDDLFSQEGDGVTGTNYMTGILWALETLAWDEEYLIHVCIILGELASRDPGGQWANRPENSLLTILLPWLPQTIAPIEKRKVAVQTLCKEFPEIGWSLIIRLFPNQHQSSSGSHKPSWRRIIPDDWEKGVSHDEYRQQVSFYTEFAISLAGHNTHKLAELIDHFGNLPNPSSEKLLEVLSSEKILNLPEGQRLRLWDHLTKFISMHRRFSSEEWTLNENLLIQIQTVADSLAPSDPINLYQHLFSDHDFNYDEENGNWEKQLRKRNKRRQKAVETILREGGVDEIIRFAGLVESPRKIGHALSSTTDTSIEPVLLPVYLDSDNNSLSLLTSGFVSGQYFTKGWSWADEIDKSSWTAGQIGQFLSYLPFTKETWNRAAHWLDDMQGEYWTKTNVNPYEANGDLDIAIDKLIEHGRPCAAIECLTKMRYAKELINIDQCIRALLAASLSAEPSKATYRHQFVELIKYLQVSSTVPSDDLFRVEWVYLQLLTHDREAAPRFLESRLASDPDFFCELIQLLYRSKKENVAENQSREDLKEIATNAWYLLHKWQTPPGMQEDGSFNDTLFSNWLRSVINDCTESGHLQVALITIGEVLIHTPADIDGLFINRLVADALNTHDLDDMRRGYRNGLYNSRGVHFVDPTGKPERDLAQQSRQKAEEAENAGFQRLAVTLRGLANEYERDAERIINEHDDEDE